MVGFSFLFSFFSSFGNLCLAVAPRLLLQKFQPDTKAGRLLNKLYGSQKKVEIQYPGLRVVEGSTENRGAFIPGGGKHDVDARTRRIKKVEVRSDYEGKPRARPAPVLYLQGRKNKASFTLFAAQLCGGFCVSSLCVCLFGVCVFKLGSRDADSTSYHGHTSTPHHRRSEQRVSTCCANVLVHSCTMLLSVATTTPTFSFSFRCSLIGND